MPLQYPPDLVKYLRKHGVKYVVVGHTPHGNAPTVIQHDGLVVLMVSHQILPLSFLSHSS